MTTVGLVLIGITLCAFVFSGQIEHWSRLSLEDTLSRAYGTRVEIARLSFAPLEFGVVAEEVRIYNPEGFDPGVAIALDRAVFRPDFRTLFTERPTIDQIKLENLQVEQQQFGGNLRILGENARIAVETGEAQGLQVRQIAVSGGEVKGLMPLKIPAFESDWIEAGMALEGDELQQELVKQLLRNVMTLNGALS
jgi:hypothetical protein